MTPSTGSLRRQPRGWLAVGYADGMVLLVRLADGAEIFARHRRGRRPRRSAGAGARSPGFGTEDGEAGLVAVQADMRVFSPT